MAAGSPSRCAASCPAGCRSLKLTCTGYVALGCLVTSGEQPPLETVYCLLEELTIPCARIHSVVWWRCVSGIAFCRDTMSEPCGFLVNGTPLFRLSGPGSFLFAGDGGRVMVRACKPRNLACADTQGVF